MSSPAPPPLPPHALLYSWAPLLHDSSVVLPSLDPRCLAAITYLQLVGASNVSVKACNDPRISPSLRLPLLQQGSRIYDGLAAIVSNTHHTLNPSLSRDGNDDDNDDIPAHLDAHLSDTQRADRLAAIAMIEDKLLDSLMYMWWLMPGQADHSFGRYKPYLSLFARFSFVNEQKRTVTRRLNEKRDWSASRKDRPTVRRGSVATATDTAKNAVGGIRAPPFYISTVDSEECTWSVDEIITMTRGCYKALAVMLGDQEYIFGDKPTSLDAYIFGYLALHYYPTGKPRTTPQTPSVADTAPRPGSPIPKDEPMPTLTELLDNEFPTLVRYLDRMRTRHLSAVHVETTSATQSFWRALVGTSATTTTDDDDDGGKEPTPIHHTSDEHHQGHDEDDDDTQTKPSLLSVLRNRDQFSWTRLWRNDQFQSLLSVVAGVAVFVGYVWIVKGGEQRRVVRAIEDIQRKQYAARHAAASSTFPQGQEDSEVEELFEEDEDEDDYIYVEDDIEDDES
ncbi:hypothetical protein RI367_006936 [Sorochytrium milnesiophthora]